MTCEEIRDLAGAYADGELDPAHQLEVGRHLERCTGCAAAVARQQAVRDALGGAALYLPAPPELRRRVRASLGRVDRPGRVLPPAARGWLAVAASLALVALLGWAVTRVHSSPSGDDLVAQQVVASHVRSLLPVEGHLVDKPSSNQHVVKPWFNGRVDFAPEVKDLKDDDFTLLGGRLDIVEQTEAAALVYKRRKHFINLFVWPMPGAADREPGATSVRGYHLIHWATGGLAYWAVSDLNEAELREFVATFRR